MIHYTVQYLSNFKLFDLYEFKYQCECFYLLNFIVFNVLIEWFMLFQELRIFEKLIIFSYRFILFYNKKACTVLSFLLF